MKKYKTLPPGIRDKTYVDKHLEGLCGAPLALKLLQELEKKYKNGIPFKEAESFLENTSRALSYGQSTDNIFKKLASHYNLIFIHNKRVYVRQINEFS